MTTQPVKASVVNVIGRTACSPKIKYSTVEEKIVKISSAGMYKRVRANWMKSP